MDKVFDSVNGTSIKTEGGKYLRTAVSKYSEHHMFWTEAIKVFKNIKFYGTKRTPPCGHTQSKIFLNFPTKLHSQDFQFYGIFIRILLIFFRCFDRIELEILVTIIIPLLIHYKWNYENTNASETVGVLTLPS